MDIGNLKNNYTFYEGYEDEDEIDPTEYLKDLMLYKEKAFDSEVLAKCDTSFLLRKTYLKKTDNPHRLQRVLKRLALPEVQHTNIW